MSKYAKYDNEILRLFKEGLTNTEIGKIIGIDYRRVSDRLKIYNLKAKPANSNNKLHIKNEQQYQVLIGTVIGDGCLFTGKNNRNYRMNLAHSLKQREYFLYKYNVLKDLINTKPTQRTWRDKRTNNTYSEIRFQSKTNPLYTELYNTWYANGKKIIPKDEIFKLNEIGLAIKYFDDGFYNSNGAYSISMCDFDNESIKNFRILLMDKFNIDTNVHKSKYIYIPKRFSLKFKDIVIPYATNDVLYKLGENRGTPNV